MTTYNILLLLSTQKWWKILPAWRVLIWWLGVVAYLLGPPCIFSAFLTLMFWCVVSRRRRHAQLYGARCWTGDRLRRVGLWQHPPVSSSSSAATAAAAGPARPADGALASASRLRCPADFRRRGPQVSQCRPPPESAFVGSGSDLAKSGRLVCRRRPRHVPAISVPVRQHRRLPPRRRWRHVPHWKSIRRKWWLRVADRRVSLPGLRRHGCQDARAKFSTADERLVMICNFVSLLNTKHSWFRRL